MDSFINPNIFEDREKSPLAGSIATITGGVLLFFSAVTSFAFFAEYAASVFSFISPALSPWLAGLVGVVSFEIMSLIWRYLHANHADTEKQMKLAQTGSKLALFGGLLVTCIYFALQTDLLRGNMDAATVTSLSLAGGLLIIIGVSGNFGLYHFYAEAGSDHQASLESNRIAAMRAQASFATQAESTRHTLRRTMAQISDALPDAAERQARAEAANWETRFFNPQQDNGRRPSNLTRVPANPKKSGENSKQNPLGDSDNGRHPK